MTTYYPAPYGGYVSLLTTGQTILARDAGLVGVGTNYPTAKLHVNGAVRITDGTEGSGKVLTSDHGGAASWREMPMDFRVVRGTITITGEDYGGDHEGCTVKVESSICSRQRAWRDGREWDRNKCHQVASNEAALFCGHRPVLHWWNNDLRGAVLFFVPV